MQDPAMRWVHIAYTMHPNEKLHAMPLKKSVPLQVG